MLLNNDFQFYAVVCDLDGDDYTPERSLSEMSYDKIVADIADGQLENVKAVFEFNPAEGWCNDVTADVMAAAFPEQDEEGEDLSDYASERITGAVAGVEHRVAA
jgi:hypothetical protein